MDATATVEARVRERVRERGLDPQAEPGTTRELVEAVIGEYDDGDGRPLRDVDVVTREVIAAIAGFGPLQQYLDDPTVEEIWVNEPGRVFVARRGRSELTTTVLGPHVVEDLVERMLRSSGRRVDLSSPFVDAALLDGSRLHVVVPDVTRRHWAVNIRKFVVRATHLDDLVELGTLTTQAARFVEASVVSGLNIVVAGGTQAGKTTLLNTLINAIPAGQRLITCEEVFELQPVLPDVVGLQTRQANLEGTGEIPLRRLVKEALRMRPNRLVVGEVRQEECLDLLVALNSGVPGMATVHANSAREAITKLCTLPLLAGENVTTSFVVPTVASSVDLVVHLATDAHGDRRVREIAAVPGRVEGDVVEVAGVFHTEGQRLVRSGGFPPHEDRFARCGYDLAELLRADETAVG